MLDVWLQVEAEDEASARRQVGRLAHAAELDIDELHGVGDIIEVEEEIKTT